MRSILALTLLSAAAIGTAAEPLSWDVRAEVSGVTNNTFRRSSDIGDVSSFDFQFQAIASAELQPSFLLRFGLELQRSDFDLPANAPLPNNLRAYAAVVGMDVQAGDAWLFRLDLHPGFYGAGTNLDFDEFNIPITAGVSYFVSADLQIIAGVGIDVNRKYPVLPAAGFRWKFARSGVLNAILPRPRLEYLISDKTTAYVGADLRLTPYRVDEIFGDSHKLSKLNNAWVDHTQIRVGAGVSSKVGSAMTFEVEAGCVTLDDFDYHRADIGVRSQDTPFYARIGLQAQF